MGGLTERERRRLRHALALPTRYQQRTADQRETARRMHATGSSRADIAARWAPTTAASTPTSATAPPSTSGRRARSSTPRRRVLVTGSRTWTDTSVIRDALAAVWHPDTVLVTGACPRGADLLAEQCWTRWGGPVQRWPARWKRDGPAAGPRRNQHMVDLGADLCLAFIHHHSRGASHCATAARRAGIPTHVFHTY